MGQENKEELVMSQRNPEVCIPDLTPLAVQALRQFAEVLFGEGAIKATAVQFIAQTGNHYFIFQVGLVYRDGEEEYAHLLKAKIPIVFVGCKEDYFDIKSWRPSPEVVGVKANNDLFAVCWGDPHSVDPTIWFAQSPCVEQEGWYKVTLKDEEELLQVPMHIRTDRALPRHPEVM